MPHSAVPLTPSQTSRRFADAVAEGLAGSPKRLPTEFFYDALGSALFDAISQLPWYPIARAELALLRTHAPEIAALAGGLSSVVELGPGNGSKLAALVGAFAGLPALTVHLVDVSHAALETASQALEHHIHELANVTLHTHQATYADGAHQALDTRARNGRALTIFLGSNIGNFDRDSADAFLRELRRVHRPGDRLLLGADLVKSEADMLLAYDDPLGVTAAFNLNLLVRINRELGADFAIEAFSHSAAWNEPHSRMEAHLVSMKRQRVKIPACGLEVAFEAGDTIWTESSHKYEPAGIAAMLTRAGFGPLHQWIGDGFALTIAEAR